MINCEIELDLSWSKEGVISKIPITPRVVGNQNTNLPVPAVAAIQTTNAKLYVPVVTLSINDDNQFLENVKHGFKRTVSKNKYRFETTKQPKNKNSDNLIDPTFRNINRLFAHIFKNGEHDPIRNSFHEYYMSLVEIK